MATNTTFSVSDLHKSALTISKSHSSLFILGLLHLFTQSMSIEYSQASEEISNITSDEGLKVVDQNNPNISTAIEAIKNLIASMHTGWYVLLGFEAIVILFFSVVISFFAQLFLSSSLIVGVSRAIQKKENELGNISHQARKSIPLLFWLFILPNLIAGICVALSIGILIGAYVLWNIPFVPIIAILGTIVAVAVGIYGGIFLKLSAIWAERFVVLQQLDWKHAMIRGYALSKTCWRNMIVLGLHNAMYVFLRVFGYILLLLLGIVCVVFISTIAEQTIQKYFILQLSSLAIVGILFITWVVFLIRFLARAQVFTSATWTSWFHKMYFGDNHA